MARKCILCGTEYDYCPSCPKDKSKAPWHKLYHSENCRNIFNALNDFNFKLISKDEAKERLSSCDLSIELNDHYRGEISEIMAEPEVIKVEVEVEPEIHNIYVDAEVVEVEVKPVTKRKSKHQPKVKEEVIEDLGGVVITE